MTLLLESPQRREKTAPLLQALSAYLLGLYLLAQCFSLPLVAVGPTWALWPTLPDVLLWLAGGAALLYQIPLASLSQRRSFAALLTAFVLAVGSFGLLFIMRDPKLSSAVSFGLFGVYKLLQIVVVFFTVSRLPLDDQLLRRWSRLVTWAFGIMVVSIVWTSFSGALPTFLAGWLPHGLGVSGPWEAYYLHNESGLGMVGYNHGYPAVQVMTLGTLLLMLRRHNTVIVAMITLACFLTGSRAGLSGALLLAVLEYRRVPLRALAIIIGLGLLALIAAPLLGQDVSLQSVIERQSTIADAGDVNNLSGRDDIWSRFSGSLFGDPLRFLLGSGFGSAINNGGNAHFNLLQILYEMGVAGLVSYGLFFWVLIRELWHSPYGRPALHLLAALGLTALTQETFYPTPAFSGFLPLLALVIAVALRRYDQASQPMPVEKTWK